MGETEDEGRVKVGIRKSESPWSWKMKEKKKKMTTENNGWRKGWWMRGKMEEEIKSMSYKKRNKRKESKFRKKRCERKRKTAEEINDDENTSFHTSLLIVRLSH